MREQPDNMARLHPLVPWALACLVTILAMVTVGRLDAIERGRLNDEARTATLVHLSTIRAKLESALNGPLLRTRGIVAHIAVNGDITEDEFSRLAKILLEGHHSVRNMVVSRGTVIAMTYPLEGNESVIGVNYQSVPAQMEMVQKAIASRSQVIQGPVTLIQGGMGLIARTPVFLDSAGGEPGPFFGMVNIVLDIPKVFAEAGLTDDHLPIRVAIRGDDGSGAEGTLIYGEKAVFDENPVQTSVLLPQGAWRLAAIPVEGWAGGRKVSRMRVLAFSIILVVAVAAFATARYVARLAATEQALRSKTLELERSNADLERFAYAASHDLQTPLRNIVSYAQLIERRYRGRLDGDADEFIGFLVDGATRMSLLVRDLLNYARVSNSSAPLMPVPARRAVDLALQNLAPEIRDTGAGIEVGDLPVVTADEVQLTSLFQNLIGNAIRYRAPDRQPLIRISARRDTEWWVISVADNGIGIDPEYFDKIFVIFQRLHTGTEGTGIGLAVCNRIMHRFGGSIGVESAPGEGAVFHVRFPTAPAP